MLENNYTEKFNPNQAPEALRKSFSGTVLWISICLIVFLTGFFVYLSVRLSNSGSQNCEERVKPYRERNAELVQEKSVLERKIFRLDSINDVLRERDLLNKFNATEGPKQIILSPKKEAK